MSDRPLPKRCRRIYVGDIMNRWLMLVFAGWVIVSGCSRDGYETAERQRRIGNSIQFLRDEQQGHSRYGNRDSAMVSSSVLSVLTTLSPADLDRPRIAAVLVSELGPPHGGVRVEYIAARPTIDAVRIRSVSKDASMILRIPTYVRQIHERDAQEFVVFTTLFMFDTNTGLRDLLIGEDSSSSLRVDLLQGERVLDSADRIVWVKGTATKRADTSPAP